MIEQSAKDILNTLLYSAVFEHPLNREEIEQFSAYNLNSNELKALLVELIELNLVFADNGFYSPFPSADTVDRRLHGMTEAEKALPKAKQIGKRISRFPFVKGVGISGSLSKGVLFNDGDFDYFIITQPNRLWLARTFLVLYKKIFLFNSRKYFCVNYFIDSDHLEIEEKNRFTATEIRTLLPVAGEVMNAFYQKNEWVKNWFHSYHSDSSCTTDEHKKGFTRLLEYLFKGRLGERLDDFCMRLTFKRWQKKFPDVDAERFDLTMKTRKYVSKHHPRDFQNRVLTKHKELIERYKTEYQKELDNAQIKL